MSLFGKKRDTEEQREYEASMTGYRLGYPVEDDQPATLHIDPNDPAFRRGLLQGVKDKQENEAYLAAHPNWQAEQAEIDRQLMERYRRK